MSLDHAARLAFARGALEGLSVGDALGEALSYQHANVRSRLDFSVFRAGSVRYTDDTAMALDIMEWLCSCRGLDEDALAWFFTRSFQNDPDRGYGRMARRILTRLSEGEDWRIVSVSAFGGGSFGNGSAMRVAPLGAYFSENMSEVVVMAAKSAVSPMRTPRGSPEQWRWLQQRPWPSAAGTWGPTKLRWKYGKR